MSELDGTCHEVHEPINIDSGTRDRLRAFLVSPEAPRGMGYSAFIEWALAHARTALAPCESDKGLCRVHGGFMVASPPEQGPDFCDLSGMDR